MEDKEDPMVKDYFHEIDAWAELENKATFNGLAYGLGSTRASYCVALELRILNKQIENLTELLVRKLNG